MIAVVLGTRPELIKTAPIIHELARRGSPFALIHTGQHYTPALDEIFFRDLELPPPAVNLHVGSLPAAHQVARILTGVSDALEQLKPRIVLVQGDTNSVLGGALAAHKLSIPLAHLEAGLRSDDWTMPEEGNRVLAGRVAALHFCPTELQAARLAGEGILHGVHVVGNTIVDASLRFAARSLEISTIFERLELGGRPYALVTMHRPSNVDDPQRLAALLDALATMARERGLELVFPVHPRTREKIRAFGLESKLAAPFRPIEPLGYIDLLRLLRGTEVALTDSGGVQEEACTLHVPCVTLRPNTERPETVGVGANALCDEADAGRIGAFVDDMREAPRDWKNPFGDGHTSERVVDILLNPRTRLAPSGAP
ncbi:non-hydrolyzing UDP-N-acetylglucosamine 2-epimerase [Pyxidicoccus sp. MSG2]|uniref:non-hydrolyzing UDP-N-acetylglucosamine 2-epimerase n=1 Tax=Pyxidicoccus sp. MSG2 TaxID=2996790 RepID=UPI00226FE4EA|nr:UDP-N-acetylglucosamine 2-epimerase (non-hydrolyzing) [Pyxidicoccus sp. MSG2]MCY1022015.1 UDP-N-acetylglucosamine 2-epimerase (non-hydrolyzing) [Pyxidicoccus sp. MSG2]